MVGGTAHSGAPANLGGTLAAVPGTAREDPAITLNKKIVGLGYFLPCQILLKGCNAKHGFYIFKYVYSFSTRRNQTQIKVRRQPGSTAGPLAWLRHATQLTGAVAVPDPSHVCPAQKEEADSQSTIPIHQLDKDNAQSGPTEDRAAPKQDDNISTDAIQHRPSLQPENHSIIGIGGHGHSPRPGTSTRARSGVGITGPTPVSSEGSGDLDLVIEVGSDVPVLPQGRRASEAMVGNRSAVRSEDRDDGAPKGVPVERPMTTGRERDPATGGAEDDSSGEATIHGQEQESIMRGTGMGGSTLASVTENIEDIQVDTKGVDEYAFIPDSGSITVTHGELGNTSFTHISPDKDDEVNIFIGRASIRVGEQESTQPSVTVGSEDDSIPTAGTSSTLSRLGFASAHGGDDDDDGIPARRQPEGPATTATPIHGDSITSSHGDDHPTRGHEDGVTTIGDGEGLVSRGNSDDEVRSEGQRFQGRPSHLPVTTIHQGDDDEAAATVPAKGASIHLGTTMTSPRVSEEDCTTAKGTASGHTEGESAMVGRGGSGEEKPATSQPRREGQPGVGVRVQLGGAGLDMTTKMYKVPSPHGKSGSRVSSEAQPTTGGHGGNAGGSPPSQAGRARGIVAAGKGQQWRQGGKAGAAVVGARGGRLPGHHGSRPRAGAAGMFAALSRSRQVDRVKHADELHLHERAFYSLGGVGGGPHGPYTGLRSADSSQSSEGEQGSLSDSHQMGLQPSGWGAPGHPHGHWSQETF